MHRQGLQLFKQSQFEEAAKWLREALTLEPTAEHWSDWASAELACGRTPQAEAGYRQALTLDLDNGEAALNLGVLCSMPGRAAEASEACSPLTRPGGNWPANFRSNAGMFWLPLEPQPRKLVSRQRILDPRNTDLWRQALGPGWRAPSNLPTAWFSKGQKKGDFFCPRKTPIFRERLFGPAFGRRVT